MKGRAGVWTIVVAGGSGNRFGGLKQFALLGGLSLADRALGMAREVSEGVILVVPAGSMGVEFPAADGVVAGGATRADSVRAGLAAVPSSAEVIVVHDAARPLATVALFQAVVAGVRDGADGAIPGLVVHDTLTKVIAGPDGMFRAVTAIDREGVVAVQTPQAFRAVTLRRAHLTGEEATDDASLVGRIGGTVVVVEGQHSNFKVTSPADLTRAAALIGSVSASLGSLGLGHP